MTQVIHGNEGNFSDLVLKSDKPVLVDFWAQWCGPCKAIAPMLDEISQENADVKIVKIDVDQNQSLAKTYGIRSIPSLYLFKDGEVVSTKLGAGSKAALTNWLDNQLSD